VLLLSEAGMLLLPILVLLLSVAGVHLYLPVAGVLLLPVDGVMLLPEAGMLHLPTAGMQLLPEAVVLMLVF
jgi:hypothetical protein